MHCDTPMNGVRALGAGGLDRRHALEKHCGEEILWSFRAGVPRATAAWRDCGEDGLRTE